MTRVFHSGIACGNSQAFCLEASAVSRSASCGSPTFCATKMDGSHCDGAYMKTCSGGDETAAWA